MIEASEGKVCPCDFFEHPLGMENSPGRKNLRRRVGTFTRFRKALLDSISSEDALHQWRARDKQDLGVMLLEMWALISDILTFYDERVANESYLKTAQRPESVKRLVRMLSYRPRPGIGSEVHLAAIAEDGKKVIVPKGLQVQSKPPPGQEPQVFEASGDTSIEAARNVWVVRPSVASTMPLDAPELLIEGTTTQLKRDSRVILVDIRRPSSTQRQAYAEIKEVIEEKDIYGRKFTHLALKKPLSQYQPEQYMMDIPYPKWEIEYTRLFLPRQTTKIKNPDLGNMVLDNPVIIKLDAAYPSIKAGDIILIVENDPNAEEKAYIFKVLGITTKVALIDENIPDLYAPYAELTLDIKWSNWRDIWTRIDNNFNKALYFEMQEVAPIIGVMDKQLSKAVTQLEFNFSEVPSVENDFNVLLKDALSQGKFERGNSATFDSDVKTGTLTGLTPRKSTFYHPVSVYANVFHATRGQTVTGEVLGSGDASQANQEVVLKKSPLTYLLAPTAENPEGYQSTLRVWVNGIKWQEVSSFFGRGADETVYVTYEDEQKRTHVIFGDGIHGARLPTGRNNVVASYRVGSGKISPSAGALTTILKPHPGLLSIINPVPPGGGDDPEPRDKIREHAPASVFTFGRAISFRDYEVMASRAPGVIRARAEWTWATDRQAATVRVLLIVDPTQNAQTVVDGVRNLLNNKGDPSKYLVVEEALPFRISLAITLTIDHRFLPAEVVKNVRSAILDDDSGLLNINRVEIGRPLFRSELMEAIVNVNGVVDVPRIQIVPGQPNGGSALERAQPGQAVTGSGPARKPISQPPTASGPAREPVSQSPTGSGSGRGSASQSPTGSGSEGGLAPQPVGGGGTSPSISGLVSGDFPLDALAIGENQYISVDTLTIQ